jgi:serine/threonine protein kinase/ligand-binding sensor domain-containing protein
VRLGPRVLLACVVAGVSWPAVSASAEPVAGSPVDVAAFARPAVRVFTDKDGLPQNTVAAEAFDTDGRLWVGTQGGLAVYDGRAFRRVPLPEGAKSEWVTAIAPLAHGVMAVGTHAGGLWIVDGARFEHVDVASGLPDDTVLSVGAAPEEGGDLWVGTRHGVARRAVGKWRTIPASEAPLLGGSVTAIAVVPGDRPRVWVGSDAGVSLFAHDAWRGYPGGEAGLPAAHVASVALDESDPAHPRVWAGLRNAGLATLEGDRWRVFSSKDGSLPCDDVGPVVPAHGGVWIGTICGGLLRWSGGAGTTIDSSGSDLPDNLVASLVPSRASQGPPALWAGTDTGGVARVELGGWRALGGKGAPARTAVYAMGWSRAPDTGALLTWIGTETGLHEYDGHAWSHPAFPGVAPADAYVNAVLDARASVAPGLWVATFGGAVHQTPAGWTAYQEASGLPSRIVLTLFEATTPAGDKELLAGMRSGFARFDGARWKPVDDPGAPTSEEVTSMVETPGPAGSPVLWVATATAGLFRREAGAWTRLSTKSSPLPCDELLQVQRVRFGAAERLYVSTGEAGLAWIDPTATSPRWSFLSTKTTPALPDQVVYGVQQDALGRVYAFTNHGVARLVADKGAPDSLTVAVFTTEDGLPSSECNSGASAVDPLGRVWAGTVGGAALLDASSEVEDHAAKRLLLRQTYLFDAPIDLAQNPSLEHDQSTLSFDLALLSFHREADTRYRTQLVGLESQPSAWTPDSKVRYTSLPAGAYELRAWGRDYAGNVSGPLVLTFRVLPAPWRTWWAMLGYLALGASVIATGYRVRVARLKRHAAELAERVEARTSELATRNAELALKNRELDRKNAELVASQERANRIFSAFTDVLPGSVLDSKYRIGERIGSGGFATVFRGVQLSLDRAVAVKVFRPAQGNDSAMALERFQREGMTACRVNHPNAIQVFDAGLSSDGIPYIVMELLEGRSLSAEIRRTGGLPLRRALGIAIPICEALAAAHAAGLVHRDIKPDNVFLSRTAEGEVVKLLDFGIAKLLDADARDDSAQTASTAFVGTPRYMAPERLSHTSYGKESDVYSLGVILYEMVLGRAPWPPTKDLFALIVKIIAGDVVPMHDLGVPEPVSRIVMRALSHEPGARVTAEQMARELGEVRASLSSEELERVYGHAPVDVSENASTEEASMPPRMQSGPLAPDDVTLAPTSNVRATKAS